MISSSLLFSIFSGELSSFVSAPPLGGGYHACECGQGPEEGRDTVGAG